MISDQKENIICTMDDVRGDFLGPPHGTTPAAVIANKNKTDEHIFENGDGPCLVSHSHMTGILLTGTLNPVQITQFTL